LRGFSPEPSLVVPFQESAQANAWRSQFEDIAKGDPVPDLIVLASPFRFVVRPIVDYALKVQAKNPSSPCLKSG